MEVVLYTQDKSLVLGDSLHLIAPLASDLDSGLDGLRASVHGQDHVETKVAGDELGKTREDVIVERTRAKGNTRGLVDQGSH